MSNKKQGFLNYYILRPANIIGSSVKKLPLIFTSIKDSKDKLDQWAEKARERLQNPAKTNFNLGVKFFQQGNVGDAIIRFKIATFMQQDYKEAYYYLARSYLLKNKISKAKINFSKAKEKGMTNSNFNYFYQIYVEQSIKAQPTKEIKEEFFDKLATLFDSYYIDNFKYKGHFKILEKITPEIEKKEKANILEIGCGRGILGALLKEKFPSISITGLDNSKNMINEAKSITYKLSNQTREEIIDLNNKENIEKEIEQKNVYDYLIRANIENFQNSQNIKYDFIMARGIISYIEDIDQFFKNIKELINKGGILVFYIKETINKEKFEDIKEQFSTPFFCNHNYYSQQEIESFASKNLFKIVNIEQAEIEKEEISSKVIIYSLKKE